MPDEFGTVNVKREDRAREIEAIRQRFRRHRDTLTNLAADAPTIALGIEYNRLIKEIDVSIGKLSALENERTPSDTQPVKRTEPGKRPLAPPPPAFETSEVDTAPRATSRIILIVIAGLVVLGAIFWLMWHASSDERPLAPVVTESLDTATTTAKIEPIAAPPPEPAATVPALTVTPKTQDFGRVRRGAHPARQYEVTNHTDQPVTLVVERSKCRCLYYAYNGTIAPQKKELVTVTLETQRVKARALKETIKVYDKNNPASETTFDVTAAIR